MTEPAAEQPPAFCPYKGLRPYTMDDRRYFFGRTSDGKIVAGSALARRLTVFFGGSGVGKTSVLRAGAVPLIEETTGVPSIYFNTWQSGDFLGRLHGTIAAALPEGAAAPALSLPELAASWGRTMSVVTAQEEETVRRPSPLMLLFDQFEEFFLYREGHRERFTRELAELVNRRDLDARVVLSLRDDRLALLEKLAPHIPDILTNRIELEPLNHRGAKDACERPIDRYNETGNPDRSDATPVAIQPALVDLVLTNVLLREPTAEGDIGPEELKRGRFDTAYLQLALTKIWAKERASGSAVLRADTFKTLGGGRGIATGHLEEELGHLSADEVYLCGRFFDRLVTSTGSKIAQPLAALRDATGLPPPGTPAPQQSWRSAIMGIVTGTIVAARAGKDDPEGTGPLPVPWQDRGTAERFGRLAAGAQPQDALTGLLQRLSDTARFILRTVPSPSRDGGPAYEIFHDVLAEPVRAWTDRFRRSLKVIDDYWWNALSLGTATLFAALMVMSLGFGAWAWWASAQAEQKAAQAAATLEWSRLESNSSGLEPTEVAALWNITRFAPAEREAFVAEIPGNTAHILKFAYHPGELSRALGLTYSRNHAAILIRPLLSLLLTTTDRGQLQALPQAVQTLGAKLTPEQAQAALGPVLDAIRRTTWPSAVQALAEAVQTLGPSPAQAHAALGPVLDAIPQTTDRGQLRALAQAVQTLGAKLTPDPAQAALGPVLDAIRQTTPPSALRALAQAFQTLGAKLQAKDRLESAGAARSILAEAETAAAAAAWASAVMVLEFDVGDATVASIVELLKYPTVGLRGEEEDGSDDPTTVLLRALAARFPQVPELTTGRLDDALAWVAKSYRRIDLDAPPERPPPLRPGDAGTG